jgi:hypothetical protein
MTELLNPIAELDKPDSGNIVTPSRAHALRKEHKFYCPDHDCKDPNRILIPAKSKLAKYFFKHKPDFGHDIHPETLLHKLAVKWFGDCTAIEIPKSDRIKQQTVELDITRTELEFRKLERIIPDVKLTTIKGFVFVIEIVVTSDIKMEKSKLIEDFKLPTLRIDLSNFYYRNKENCRTDYEFVKSNLDGLLTDINIKSWAIAPTNSNLDSLDLEELKPNPATTAENTGCLVVLFTLGTIIILRKWIK